MRDNMELFKENITLLKEQNRGLQKKLLHQNQKPGQDLKAENGPYKASQDQISQLFNELRSDNESMAKELRRLEDLNKGLRDKIIKYKSKITE